MRYRSRGRERGSMRLRHRDHSWVGAAAGVAQKAGPSGSVDVQANGKRVRAKGRA